MPVFARLYKQSPTELFHASWKASRLSLKSAYQMAFEAAERRNELLHVMNKELQVNAYAEDILAHHQASIVLLVADDLLQRLGRGITGRYPGLKVGFGLKVRDKAALTVMLRAMTNCIRHASGWDDDSDLDDLDSEKLFFPYSDPRNYRKGQALNSIRVIQDVFGFGLQERIHMAPCFDALAVVDGLWWSGRTSASFDRFEVAILEAAKEMMSVA